MALILLKDKLNNYLLSYGTECYMKLEILRRKMKKLKKKPKKLIIQQIMAAQRSYKARVEPQRALEISNLTALEESTYNLIHGEDGIDSYDEYVTYLQNQSNIKQKNIKQKNIKQKKEIIVKHK